MNNLDSSYSHDQMSLPLGEYLEVDTVVAELSHVLNLSDEEVYAKFPRLKGFDGTLSLEKATNITETKHQSGGSITNVEAKKALSIGAYKDGELLFAYFLRTDGSVNGARYEDHVVLPMEEIA